MWNIKPDEPTAADLDKVVEEEKIKQATEADEPTTEDLKTEAEEVKAELAVPVYVDPWDVEPLPPTPPADDADRPRWIRDNVIYLEKLGQHRSWLALKASHPEIAERQAWARKNLAG